MGKKLKKVFAFCLALNVSISTMGMTALAAETTTKAETIPNSNGTTTEKITTTTTETDPETGEVTMVIEIQEITSGTEKGMQENAPALTVDVPMTTVDDPETEEVENSNTVEGAPVGTTTVSGDPKDSPTDDEYDATTSTVVSQGSVTVTTEEITVTETVKTGDTDLSHVASETAPSETNDLIKENQTAAPEQYLPGNEDATPAESECTLTENETSTGNETPAENDNYQFEYAGTGNTSQFRPAVVFTEPLTDEQKVEQYGDHYYNGAYIVKDYYTTHFVNQLDPAYRDTIAKNEDGTYKTDDAGYLLDKDGNRVLKKEQTMVGPDGKTYYLHRFDNNGSGNYVEGWYQDGEWQKELNAPADVDANGNPIALEKVQLLDKNGAPVLDNDGNPVFVDVSYKHKNERNQYLTDEKGNIVTSYGAVWTGAQQFVLVDKETGEVITTYCADLTTKTEMGFGYNIVNLEDSTYYSDEQAAQIRAIAANGYWGTVGYETDADGNPVYKTDADGKVITDDAGNPIPVPQTGSLDAMKEMLLASGQFSEEELASLTDGVALTATQMAIWSCSNHMAGTEFINTHYFGNPDQVETDSTGVGGNVPMDKEAEAKLMFRVYEYLKGLAPVSYEGKETTANTIINADNFLEEMAVTVVEKADDHANNQDDDDTNDAYVTNLTFALVVTPSTENGDDLIVKVLDANGKELASGRIAGEVKEGENVLTPDKDGNYSFTGITLTEGNQNFNITLEGIQHLEQGVYLYTSEVREDVSSQTMVGIAEGNREVDVSMNICFEFSVEDEIVATERVWRKERTSTEVIIPDEEPPLSNVPVEEPVDPPTEPEQTPDEPVVEISDEMLPLTDISNEDIPLANVPKTGDTSALWIALSALFGSCLIGLTILDRKRSEG